MTVHGNLNKLAQLAYDTGVLVGRVAGSWDGLSDESKFQWRRVAIAVGMEAALHIKQNEEDNGSRSSPEGSVGGQ